MLKWLWGSNTNEKKGKKIYDQIMEYYKFHKQIESYFMEGYNNDADEIKKDTIYFIDLDWINNWKLFNDYDKIIYSLTNEDYINKELIDNDDKELFPFNCGSGYSSSIFLSKIILKLEDFDCLINQETLKLFGDNNNLDIIEIKFYKKMLMLFIENQKRIKVFYNRKKNGEKELFQLNIDCLIPVDYKEDLFFSFKYKYINNNEKLIKVFEDKNIFNIIEYKYEEEGFSCIIYNNNLFKKEYLTNYNIKYDLNNLDKPRLIGLENIGATCYMNAILQCLINIDKLTRYLLLPKNFNDIRNNNCEVLNCYCYLLIELCCDEKIQNYFSPKEFKEIISIKNPLFKGIQANDSKDFIYFFIEQANYELNQIGLKMNNTSIKCYKNLLSFKNIETDRNLMLEHFIDEFSDKNNIISKLFFSIIESEIVCQNCKIGKYNFQTYFSLEFPLEEIYNNKTSNEKKILSLYECFSYFNKSNIFQNENSIFCNKCNSQQNAIYTNKIYSLPPILIIVLNRGKGNIFKCDIDFPENLDVTKYIEFDKNNYNYEYKLIGVVTHLGNSDMSGHFIAFCRHRILKDWYCYNDATVTYCKDQINEYKNGEPYILIYETKQGNNNVLIKEKNINEKDNNYKNNNINKINCNINNQFSNNNSNLNFINNINNFNNYINNINMNNQNVMANNNNYSMINNNINYCLSSIMNNMNQNIQVNNMNNNINMDNNMNNNMNMNMNMNMNNNMNMDNNMNNNINMNPEYMFPFLDFLDIYKDVKIIYE